LVVAARAELEDERAEGVRDGAAEDDALLVGLAGGGGEDVRGGEVRGEVGVGEADGDRGGVVGGVVGGVDGGVVVARGAGRREARRAREDDAERGDAAPERPRRVGY
jgi:hypothetical protein